MMTRPAPARVLSASRTGVLETPSTAARSVSTSGRPGLSSPTRIACLIASSTATVRDGSAPAAPVRNADLGGESGIMYRISYMTGLNVTPGRHGSQTSTRIINTSCSRYLDQGILSFVSGGTDPKALRALAHP